MRRASGARRSGFALLPVVLALALLGATAYLMARESAMGVSQLSSTQRADTARYVAEAALRHAEWRVQAANCSGYSDLPSTSFGFHTYSATVAPASGSPVTLEATGLLADGTPHTLRRAEVPAYQTPTSVTLRLGTDPGRDALIDSFYPRNFGGANYLTVSKDPSWLQRTMLDFDVSGIPGGAKVLSAQLELRMWSVSSPGSATAHRVTRPWIEGTRTGGGTADGATWDTHDGAGAWSAAGGDFDPQPVAAADIASGVDWVNWEIGPLVQRWVDGSLPNDGLVLVGADGLNVATFASREASNAADRPGLTVVYACECGGGTSDSSTLQPGSAAGADTYLDDGTPSTNLSTAAEIRISNKTNSQKRGLLHFDLSGISPAATVTAAELELNLEGIGSGAAATIYAHRVLQAWIEAQATWNEARSGTPWATPGGAYDPTAVASADIDPLILGPTTWNLTSLAADWVADPATNHGLMLLGSADVNHADFTTSDSATAGLRPKLTVTYACPCGADCSAPVPQNYRDEFNSFICDTAVDYSQSDGTLDWSGFTWVELNDTDSCSGGVKLRDDGAGTYSRISTPDKGIERAVDLSMLSPAVLTFDYQRIAGFAETNDRMAARVSDDGGGSWNEVLAITGTGTDATIQTAVVDISAYASATSVVRFVLENTTDGTDILLLDNVQIDNFTEPNAAANTLILNPEGDTRIDKGAPDTNYGTDPQLRVGTASGSGQRKPFSSLLRFDVSSLAAGATVTQATLRLYVEDSVGSGVNVGAYRITADWDEATATWNSTGGGGTYDPAQLDVVNVPVAPGWAEWSLSPGLIHEWRDGVPAPDSDYGVILVDEDTFKGEWANPASKDHVDPALRPQLVLEYLEP